MRKVIYLASPYTHPDIGVRHDRELKVSIAAGNLIKKGYSVIAPITQSHRIAEVAGDDLVQLDHGLWMSVDLPLVKVSSAVFVLTIDGWHTSTGVNMEQAFAKEHNIPVRFINLDGEFCGE